MAALVLLDNLSMEVEIEPNQSLRLHCRSRQTRSPFYRCAAIDWAAHVDDHLPVDPGSEVSCSLLPA